MGLLCWRPRRSVPAMSLCLALTWVACIGWWWSRGGIGTPGTRGHPRHSGRYHRSSSSSASLECSVATPECEDRATVLRRYALGNGSATATGYDREACCQEHPVLNTILAELAAFFEEERIDWFADKGTLLSVIRDRGRLIPWDDDADMVVVMGPGDTFDSFAQRLMKFNDAPAGDVGSARDGGATTGTPVGSPGGSPGTWRNGLSMRQCNWDPILHSCNTAFKVAPAGKVRDSGGHVHIDGPSVDVQIMVKVGTETDPMSCIISAPCYKYVNTWWRWQVELPIATVLPTVPCDYPLSGRQVKAMCPADAGDYLSFFYGDDYYRPIENNDLWGVHAGGAASTDRSKFASQRSPRMRAVMGAHMRKLMFPANPHAHVDAGAGAGADAGGSLLMTGVDVVGFQDEWGNPCSQWVGRKDCKADAVKMGISEDGASAIALNCGRSCGGAEGGASMMVGVGGPGHLVGGIRGSAGDPLKVNVATVIRQHGPLLRAVAAGIRLKVPVFVWQRLVPDLASLEGAGWQIMTGCELMRNGIVGEEAVALGANDANSRGLLQVSEEHRCCVCVCVCVCARVCVRVCVTSVNRGMDGHTPHLSLPSLPPPFMQFLVNMVNDEKTRVDQSDIQNYLEGAERRVMIQHAMALAAQRHLPRLRPLNPG